MTSPNPGHNPEPSNRRLRLSLIQRISIAVGLVSLTALVGEAWWAWVWIHQQLVPLVESNLNQLLGRPIELGEVEQVGFDSIRFGASAIPATPTDPDRITTEGVIVEFALLPLLLDRALQLNVILEEANAYIEQSADERWISTELQSEEEDGAGFLTTELQSIRLRDADLVLNPLSEPNIPDENVQLADVNGVVRFLEDNELIEFDLRGEAPQGGTLQLAGETRPATQQTELTVRGQDLPAVNVSRLLDLPIALQSGEVNGNLNIQFQSLDQLPDINGTATFDDVAAQIAEIPQTFTNSNGRLRFRGETIAFDNLRTRYGELPTQIEGTINFDTGYDLTAEAIEPVPVQNVLDTFEISSPVPLDGELTANLRVEGALEQPVLVGTATTVNTAEIDQVDFSNITTQFRLSVAGEVPTVTFPEIRAIPQAGGQIIGEGQLQLGEVPNVAFTFAAANVPGDAIARLYDVSPAITIGDVAATARVVGTTSDLQTIVQFQLPEATYPGQGELVIANGGNILLRDAVFNVAGGVVEATGQLAEGQFQATIDAAQVQLNQFSEDLRGQLSGTLQLAGSTANFQPSNLQAEGQLRFSEGLAVIQDPLTAQVRWNGEQIIVQQATAPGLVASGTVDVQLEGTPQIEQFNLAVQTEDYNLQDLGLGLPQNVALAGQADFTGRVTGTPTAPRAVGALQVENLRADGLVFDPVLTGQLNYQAGQRTDLQLAGTQDRIALTLGPDNRPLSFFVRQDQAVAQGRTQGDTLLVDLQRIPLALVEGFIPENALAAGPIAGDISGDLAVNLNTYAVQGELAVANPRIGRIAADLFQGTIRFADGVVTLTDGVIQQGESQIALGGTIPIAGTQPVDFRIALDQVKVQNILQTLSLFEFGDFATGLQTPDLAEAADVRPVPINVTELSLLNQLRRLSEIETLLARQQAEEDAEPLPTLAELQGTLSGTIAFTGALEAGLDVAFDLQGQDWIWGDYVINQVIAEGSFQDGVLTASPVRVEVDEGFVAFTGQVGAEQLSGQLRASDVPVELLEPVLTQLPVDVDGQLDAVATLAGSLDRPNVLGEIILESGRVNDQPVERAQAIFGYENAQFNFTSDILVAGTEPIDIVGSIPIALPFAEVQPVSNQISIRADVEDGGLAIVNLFTDQITWIEGQGQLELAVGGTLNQPIVDGLLTVQDATLKPQALADPLTDVTGTVRLNDNRLVVDQLLANYNNDQVTAAGILPLFASQSEIANPLTVAFNDLTLDLNGIYEGDVSGNVILTGAALEPTIGGTIRLTDGEVIIGGAGAAEEDEVEGVENIEDEDTEDEKIDEIEEASNPLLTPDSAVTAATLPDGTPAVSSPIPLAFNNLQIVLAEDVRVTREPILSFEVAGDLTLNGTLENLQPQGAVELTSGQINLFATQFVLAQGEDQIVRFTPEGGLDPFLDIQLFALVPQVSGNLISTSTPTLPASSDVAETPDFFGTVRTIRVEASVTGRASELSENLQLTSDPNRSEAEIIALLGQSYLNALQADPLLGAATLAGSALFGGDLQVLITELGQAIGLSELRVFPTLITDEEADGASVLGLAVEGVVDLTDDFSVSVAGVAGAEDPVRYSVIYRINNQLRVQASTNLSGESRAVIQYEIVF